MAEQLASTQRMAEDLVEAQSAALKSQETILRNGEELKSTLQHSTKGNGGFLWGGVFILVECRHFVYKPLSVEMPLLLLTVNVRHLVEVRCAPFLFTRAKVDNQWARFYIVGLRIRIKRRPSSVFPSRLKRAYKRNCSTFFSQQGIFGIITCGPRVIFLFPTYRFRRRSEGRVC